MKTNIVFYRAKAKVLFFSFLGLMGVHSVLSGFVAPVFAAEDLRVGLVLDTGGKDDDSFNASAYRGLQRVEKELKAFGKYVEATDDNAFEPLLRSFAQKDFNLIIAVGVPQATALKKIAPLFPKKQFAILDATVDEPNVRSIVFEEHEGAYLMGALAALTSKTGKVGFIGGMDIALIRRFELGFLEGAKATRSDIKTTSNYVGITGDAWNNPAKGKELAIAQYSSGTDVIFAAAGASNKGIFDAAEEKQRFAIGTDSNQNWMKPGRILSSMLKRLDLAVFQLCQDKKDGKLTAGVTRMGLKDQGIAYALDQYNEKLIPKPVLDKIEKIKADLIAHKIKVSDYYNLRK